MGQAIQIDTASGSIGGYRADPQAAVQGALVVVQEIFGLNGHIRSVVDRFAADGFITAAPALFDHVERDVQLGYDTDGVARGRALAAAVGFERAVASVLACARQLEGEARVGVVGFCWGGTVAFLSGVRGNYPAVVYYGGRSVPFLHERGSAPLLFHFGERDPLIPEKDRALHRELQPQARIHVYPAGHGFNCEQRADFDPASSALAMRRTLAFFGRHLS
jgi:carboxymethylenebutenolidase